MGENEARRVEIFYAYAQQDQERRDELAKHLTEQYIINWHNRQITPGENRAAQIDQHLNSAQIFLLLVSPDFVASGYCNGDEMKRMLERHLAGEAQVIPVILRPVHWSGLPFSKLQVLPANKLPVTSWTNTDKAYFEVGEGVRLAAYQCLLEQYLADGRRQKEGKRSEQALQAYERAIYYAEMLPAYQHLDALYYELWKLLVDVRRYEKALEIFDQHAAVQAQIRSSSQLPEVGRICVELKKYNRALTCYEEAIKLTEHNAHLHYERGKVLIKLDRKAEALQAFEKALALRQDRPEFYKARGDILRSMQRHEAAIYAYQEAIQLQPQEVDYHFSLGDTYLALQQYELALKAYGQALDRGKRGAEIWRNIGQALSGMKRPDEALEAYQEALTHEPQNPWLWKEKGDILVEQDQLRDAWLAYREAVRLRPDYLIAWKSLTIVLDSLAKQTFEYYTQEAEKAREEISKLEQHHKPADSAH